MEMKEIGICVRLLKIFKSCLIFAMIVVLTVAFSFNVQSSANAKANSVDTTNAKSAESNTKGKKGKMADPQKIELPTGGVKMPEIEILGEKDQDEIIPGDNTQKGKLQKKAEKNSISEKTLKPKDYSSATNPCTSLSEAGKELAVKLANRESLPTIACSENFGAANIMDEARKHVGEGNKGDYLHWTMGGYFVSWTISSVYTFTFDKSGKYNYYTSLSQEKTMNTKVPQTLSEIGVSSKSTDYDKFSAIYDWICSNVIYDNENLYNDNYKLMYTAYAALVNKTAVCQGYANLLYRMLLESGVDCRIITGTAKGGNHAWNIVKINGKWYNVDVTWDAAIKQAGMDWGIEQGYEYFLKSAANFGEDHVRGDEYDTDEFNRTYPTSTSDWSESDGKGCQHAYSLKETKHGCFDFGYTAYRCSKCANEYKTAFTDPSGHNYSRYIYKNANQHLKMCVGCDKEDGLYPHKWNSGAITKQPTTAQAGTRTYTCTECKGTKTETIPKLTPPASGTSNNDPSKPANNDPNKPANNDPNKPVNNPSTNSNWKASGQAIESIGEDTSIPKISASSIKTVANIKGGKMKIVIPKGVSGASDYVVAARFGSSVSKSPWKYSLTGGKKTYVITGIKKKALLQFKVAAVKNGKRSPWSKTDYRWFQHASARAKAGKKSFVLKLKKVPGASGYEVHYSLKKSFAGSKVKITKGAAKTKIKVKKLKKRSLYYIKYRPYKRYKGMKYYGIMKTTKCKVK